MRKTLLALCAAAMAPLAHGQVSYPAWQSGAGLQPVPTTQTTLYAGRTNVTGIHLSDPSGTAATVSIYDGTTLVYSIAIGGSNPTIFDLPASSYGIPFAGAVSWKSSVANVVLGNMTGAY